MTIRDLTPLLQCPDCDGELAYEPVPQRSAEAGDSGRLRCACFAYPVLDGVPILTKARLAHHSIADARVLIDGPTPTDLGALIEDGRALDALVDLLAFPVCPWPLNRVGALRRLSVREPLRTLGLTARRRRVLRMLARKDTLTAEDWLSVFYWHAPVPYDPFSYFFFRVGQTRHLATLDLLAMLPEGRLLDLACGYGHFLHAFTADGKGTGVGLDQNFHQMWVARHYVAPGAAFVCADADRPLPFRDEVFSASLCADVFQHIRDKASCLADLRRCADGPVLLACVSNRLVDPPDGDDLTPEGYAALLEGTRWRVLSETDLVDRYLGGLGPDLRTSSEPAAVAASRWLYYVVADDDVLFREHGPMGAWPHAAGALQVNPLYEIDGDQALLRFPSSWYATENGAMLRYMPPSASLRDEADDDLIARLVLVGLPERYARPAGRPWTVAANRVLDGLVRRRGA